MDSNQRELPAKTMHWLREQVSGWLQDGIIDQGQAAAIMAWYKEKPDQAETERSGRLVTVLGILGALLLGTGVILFFAANWQAIPKWSKVALILGSIVAAYGTGYYLAFARQNYPRVGRALIFLGSVLYGSGIWLIAQVFNINSHYPNGMLFWGLGIIPVVLACNSLSVLIEASCLITAWTVMEQNGFNNINYWYWPVFAVILFLAYRAKSRLALGLTLPGPLIWAFSASITSIEEANGAAYGFLLVVLMGLLIFSLSRLADYRRDLAFVRIPCQVVGLLGFFLGFFLLTFDFLNYHTRQVITDSPLYMVLAGAAFLAVLGLRIFNLTRGQGDRGRRREDVLVLLAAVSAAVLMFVWPAAAYRVFVLSANLIFFAAVVAVIITGYTGSQPVMINLGLVFFVFDVIARYFDFFWKMLPKSVFFMAGGILLLAGGTLLERNRRKILREMRGHDYAA